MKTQDEPSSVRGATSVSSSAATVGESPAEKPRASAPAGSSKTDRPALGEGGGPGRTSARKSKGRRNGGLPPIGGRDMIKQKSSRGSEAVLTSPSAAATAGRDHPAEQAPASVPEGASIGEVRSYDAIEVPLERLVAAEWNANRMPQKLLVKLTRSITRFGIVEPLVVRPHPDGSEQLEVLSGNQRLQVYRQLGLPLVSVVIVELADAPARLLAQTLNRTRGSDDPKAYAAVLERMLLQFPPAEVSELLPESEATIDRHLREYGQNRPEEPSVPLPPAQPRSRLGELYELGPHRLLCGDATDPEQVARLLGEETVALLVTDPPYGGGVDHSWRDGLRQPAGSARTATLLNDDRADWRAAYRLSRAPVAYVWHSALHASEVSDGLQEAGFVIRQQIIWVKQIHALSRSHYQWIHEPCWYAVRKGASASWQGGRKQTTVWTDASPIAGFGGGSDEDTATAHPTQKPLSLYTTAILNHTQPGDVIYDPFGGSGTALIAAQKHGRRCLMVELDPAWCDVIRDRYQALTGKAD